MKKTILILACLGLFLVTSKAITTLDESVKVQQIDCGYSQLSFVFEIASIATPEVLVLNAEVSTFNVFKTEIFTVKTIDFGNVLYSPGRVHSIKLYPIILNFATKGKYQNPRIHCRRWVSCIKQCFNSQKTNLV